MVARLWGEREKKRARRGSARARRGLQRRDARRQERAVRGSGRHLHSVFLVAEGQLNAVCPLVQQHFALWEAQEHGDGARERRGQRAARSVGLGVASFPSPARKEARASKRNARAGDRR